MFGCAKHLCLRVPPYCRVFSVRAPVQNQPSVEGVTSLTHQVHSCCKSNPVWAQSCVKCSLSVCVKCTANVFFPICGLHRAFSIRCNAGQLLRYWSIYDSFSYIMWCSMCICIRTSVKAYRSPTHTRTSEDDTETASKEIQRSLWVLLCLSPPLVTSYFWDAPCYIGGCSLFSRVWQLKQFSYIGGCSLFSRVRQM
jgi:hypothetical protein